MTDILRDKKKKTKKTFLAWFEPWQVYDFWTHPWEPNGALGPNLQSFSKTSPFSNSLALSTRLLKSHVNFRNSEAIAVKGTGTHSSIQLSRRGARSFGRSSHPCIPSKLDWPGSTASTNAEKPLINLTVWLKDSWLNVFIDLNSETIRQSQRNSATCEVTTSEGSAAQERPAYVLWRECTRDVQFRG